MSLLQASLIALWAGYCSYDDQGPQMFRRPLLIGPIVGVILQDMRSGLIVSATLELMWMGLGNMAGYRTPDMIIGTIVGVVVSIQTGSGTNAEGIAAGVASATTVAVLAQQLLLLFDFIKQMFAPWADRLALTGNFNAVLRINMIAIIVQFFVRAIPTFLVVYFSDTMVQHILQVIPTSILSGLSTAALLLPAIGLSILMTMMMKGHFWPFLLFGFVLSSYLQLDILAITLVSLAIAILYSMIMEIRDDQKTTKISKEDPEVYDL